MTFGTQCNIFPGLCRGQAEDASANMSGHLKGDAASFKVHNHGAVFVCCLAHFLNLCLQVAGKKMPSDSGCVGHCATQLIKQSPQTEPCIPNAHQCDGRILGRMSWWTRSGTWEHSSLSWTIQHLYRCAPVQLNSCQRHPKTLNTEKHCYRTNQSTVAITSFSALVR